MNPTLPGVAAAAVIATQIQQAYIKNSIADASATAADLIRQNAMLNAVNDTSTLIGQKINDPAAMILAVGRAQATAQQNAAWINNGKVAEQALPVFRNVIEALTYALFLVVVLLMMLTSGRETMMVFKGYAYLLIWIQLWPPLYAVLNYMASIYSAYDLAAAADLGTGVRSLSLRTSSSIYSGAISGEAVVGYLAMSIPFIAWAALKRMESIGTALIGGLAGLQSILGSSTGAAATGNVNMGNVAMDQAQLAPNRTSAFMSNWQNDLSGNTTSSNALTGRTAMSLLRNQGFASRVVSMRISEQDVAEANRQVDSSRSEAISASHQRSSVLTEAFTRGLSNVRSNRSSSGTSSSSFEQAGESLNRLDQIAKNISERTGVSQSQVASIAFGANGSLGLSTSVASARATTSAGKNYQSGILTDEQKVLGAMTSEQVAEFKQFGDRLSRDASLISAISSDARESRELSSRLSAAATQSERAEASLSERQAMAEKLSSARERGETLSIDIAQDPHNLAMFMRYAEQYGGDSAAAHMLMESELARQALRPTRTFSDGSAMPSSFDDIRQRHEQGRHADALDARVDDDRRVNDHRVRGMTVKPLAPAADLSQPAPIRSEVREQRAQVQSQTRQSIEKFDASSAVAPQSDGTLESKKSLLIQAGKQVAADADATLDNAKDVVKGILDKDR